MNSKPNKKWVNMLRIFDPTFTTWVNMLRIPSDGGSICSGLFLLLFSQNNQILAYFTPFTSLLPRVGQHQPDCQALALLNPTF
jgi:hypothetical protein